MTWLRYQFQLKPPEYMDLNDADMTELQRVRCIEEAKMYVCNTVSLNSLRFGTAVPNRQPKLRVVKHPPASVMRQKIAVLRASMRLERAQLKRYEEELPKCR